jgi:hypothetical protein
LVGDTIDVPLWRLGLLLGLWLLCFVLAAAGFVLVFLVQDAAFKRRWYRPYAILFSTIIACGFIAFEPSRGVLLLVIPAIIVITVLHIRSTRFCGRCGKVNGMNGSLVVPHFCAKCGAPLET